jgi:hypothetical protein
MCELTTMLMIGSTVMGAAGAVQQGKAAQASANYNAKVADMNAKISERQARDAVERGALEEQQQRMKTSQVIGQQRAAMAANGVDLTFGSPLDTLVDTATMGELDALTIRANTYREERDIRQQGNNQTAQASAFRAEGANARKAGFMDAFGTILGGGSKAYSNYRMVA